MTLSCVRQVTPLLSEPLLFPDGSPIVRSVTFPQPLAAGSHIAVVAFYRSQAAQTETPTLNGALINVTSNLGGTFASMDRVPWAGPDDTGYWDYVLNPWMSTRMAEGNCTLTLTFDGTAATYAGFHAYAIELTGLADNPGAAIYTHPGGQFESDLLINPLVNVPQARCLLLSAIASWYAPLSIDEVGYEVIASKTEGGGLTAMLIGGLETSSVVPVHTQFRNVGPEYGSTCFTAVLKMADAVPVGTNRILVSVRKEAAGAPNVRATVFQDSTTRNVGDYVFERAGLQFDYDLVDGAARLVIPIEDQDVGKFVDGGTARVAIRQTAPTLPGGELLGVREFVTGAVELYRDPGGDPDPGIPTPPAIVPTIAGGYGVTAPPYLRLVGPGLHAADKLAYTYTQRYSGNDCATDARFVAPMSGRIIGFRPFLPDLRDSPGGGYAGGNGGTLLSRLFPGLSSGFIDWAAAALGSYSYTVPMGSRVGAADGCFANAAGMFPLLPFDALIIAGQPYHMLFEQKDANPGTNFVNIDHSTRSTSRGVDPWLAASQWAVLKGERTAGASDSTAYTWTDITTTPYPDVLYQPCIQFYMEGGASFGVSLIEFGNQVGGTGYAFTSGNPWRERFRMDAATTISAFSALTATEVAGNLNWSFKNGSTVLSSGTITQASANHTTQVIQGATYAVPARYDVALPSQITLPAGVDIDLVFEPQGSSKWHVGIQNNGGAFGFTYPAAFLQSKAQHYYSGAWIHSWIWDHTVDYPGDKSNWPVLLHRAA